LIRDVGISPADLRQMTVVAAKNLLRDDAQDDERIDATPENMQKLLGGLIGGRSNSPSAVAQPPQPFMK